ncbi:MAG TPA: hypothetical protein VJT50_12500 [Pyrinomonadaceae bacterium]|nr:hypothetical protein [Pyrinomonadaceae bacterium]
MRKVLLVAVALLSLGISASAQTADEIVAKFIKTVGGADKIQSVKTLRKVGTFNGGGGFEAAILEENKRDKMVRQEFSLQGLTAIVAYDGNRAWQIQPFGGKKDPEPLGEEEMKQILEDSDFDGPLVNYQQKGNKIEYVGMEPVEGTDAYKLKVTLASGDVRYYYMDTDYYVPIKIDTKRMVRGAEREYETSLGDYKEVSGWYLPFSIETNVKGSSNRQKVTYQKMEANVVIDDSRFHIPSAPAATAAPAAKPPDASETLPKKNDDKKPPAKPATKP